MRIYYFCFDHDRPTGGVKQIYRHVDILRRHGHEAFVLHDTPGARATWFANQTPIIDRATFVRQHDATFDLVVLPEDLGDRILEFPGHKVIFNQNVFAGFTALHWSTPTYPYLDPDVVATLTVSDHNREYLSFAYPQTKVLRVHCGVDASRFTFRPLAEKKRRVVCADKSPEDVCTLLHILQSRARQGLNRLQDYGWALLRGRSEADVATLFGESLLFIFLSTTEGLALTPLEAMLSGCLVVAHGVGPPTEYLPAGLRLQPHDLLGMALWIEDLADRFPDRLGDLQAVADAGRAAALQYTLEREEESVLSAWARIRELMK
jgi:glycosyltransferase involved in cell wall biosynthesis